MRKLVWLLAIAGLAGCAGNGNDQFDLNQPLPVAGMYTGDGAIRTNGSNNPVTAPIQSAEVDSQGQTHFVVGPFGGEGGTTYSFSGSFLRNRQFNGNVTTNGGVTSTHVTGTFNTSNSEFELSIPNYPNSNQTFSVVAQLDNPV